MIVNSQIGIAEMMVKGINYGFSVHEEDEANRLLMVGRDIQPIVFWKMKHLCAWWFF
jgi:hypothetical protein